MRNSSYSGWQKFLHWLSAVIIIWALGSGFYVSLFDVSLAVKEWVAFVNVSLTTVFLPFFALRVFLHWRHSRHENRQPLSPVELFVLFMHRLIYLVTGVVMVTGFLMMDRAINVFDVLLIPQPLTNAYLIVLFFKIHIVACVLLALLVALHVAAVIKHEASGRRVLKLMSFRR
ncbi:MULTISPECIES: cytochrome b [Pseudomonas]|uniref:cytochrome b n=1 Tax=Pseudomonas TaxID=286 RepID=UPI000CD087AB|nr:MULTISPECIES: cytochrome b/b6 domain-containing protein [unclassified Pseudomonas]POA30147.1 cytochrome B [Pseudomonas sp. GW456-R21]POA66700.1 cytochrome B [Pseudomonas sp. GW460-R15]